MYMYWCLSLDMCYVRKLRNIPKSPQQRKDGQGELRIHQSLVEDKIANLESGVDFVDTVFEYWSPLEVLTVENDIGKLALVKQVYNCLF